MDFLARRREKRMTVIPAKAGIQSGLSSLDSRFRGNDGVGFNCDMKHVA
jgi:hypothetical protein